MSWGQGVVAFSICSHEQTTKSAVFLYCSFSLFLGGGGPFFQIIKTLWQLSLCRVEFVKLLPVHQYSVFPYSGLLGILCHDGK